MRIANAAFVADAPAFDVSRDGTIIYSAPNDTAVPAGFTAVLVDRAGRETTVVAQKAAWSEPRVSPDGRTLVLRDITTPNCVLWSVDLQRGIRTRVSFEADNHNPVWRPDGQLTWGAAVEGVRGIVLGRVDRASVSVTDLARGEFERVPDSWTRDGRVLAFTEVHPERGQDIWMFDSTSGEARPFVSSNYREQQPRFSPDGHWLAYMSNASGRPEVYVQRVAENGARLQVSVEGGHSPVWSPDGKELFYVEQNALMQVTIDLTRAQPDISPPRKLFDGGYVWERLGNFDVTPDGRSFVFIRRTDDSDPAATLRVLINWLQ